MKKIAYVCNLVLMGILVNSHLVFASTPALVPSIRGEALLNISTTLDTDTSAVFIYGDSTNTNESLSIITISGVSERQGIASSTPLYSILTPEEINSQEDLKKYIKVLIMNNPDLTSVTVNGNTVTMERTISGKFLGLIAVPVQETAEVTNWGGGGSEVSVISPWWNIFSEQYSDDQITEKLYIKIKTIPTTQFGVNLNTQTQGRILSEMDSTFNEHSVDVVK